MRTYPILQPPLIYPFYLNNTGLVHSAASLPQLYLDLSTNSIMNEQTINIHICTPLGLYNGHDDDNDDDNDDAYGDDDKDDIPSRHEATLCQGTRYSCSLPSTITDARPKRSLPCF
jgi:hypothetical protein